MKLFDRITLLKAGYTRKEIDQMIEDEKQEAAAAPEQAEPEEVVQPEQEKKEDPEPEDQHEDPEPEKKEDPEPETDYKALYEAERKAKEALQKQNRDRDRTDNSKKSDVDTVKDVVASFF